MAPCVYHMSSLSNAITLPVPNKVVTQAVLFEGEKVGVCISLWVAMQHF